MFKEKKVNFSAPYMNYLKENVTVPIVGTSDIKTRRIEFATLKETKIYKT